MHALLLLLLLLYRYINREERGGGRCGIQKQIWITIKKKNIITAGLSL